jgi:hypothetical protein
MNKFNCININTLENIGTKLSHFDEIPNNDKRYTIEFHNNRIKIVSYDDESGMKTFLVLTSIKFA